MQVLAVNRIRFYHSIFTVARISTRLGLIPIYLSHPPGKAYNIVTYHVSNWHTGSISSHFIGDKAPADVDNYTQLPNEGSTVLQGEPSADLLVDQVPTWPKGSGNGVCQMYVPLVVILPLIFLMAHKSCFLSLCNSYAWGISIRRQQQATVLCCQT